MNPKPVDRRVRRTKNGLKKGLIQLLRKKSIDTITVKELTDSVDLGRGTFYFYYHDIYHLLEEIEEEILQDFRHKMNEFSAKELKNKPGPLILESLLYVSNNKGIIMLLMEMNRGFSEKFNHIIGEKCINDWVILYERNNKEYYEYFKTYVINGCASIFKHWLTT
ncbi:TetR/AcrR family transcriptional regulator, partial [Priestia megaterium]